METTVLLKMLGVVAYLRVLNISVGIELRLTKLRRPQTNAMVERFKERIVNILRTYHFQSGKELEHTLMRYMCLYDKHPPQVNLDLG